VRRSNYGVRRVIRIASPLYPGIDESCQACGKLLEVWAHWWSRPCDPSPC